MASKDYIFKNEKLCSEIVIVQTGAITVKIVSQVDVLDIDTNTYAHVYACVYLFVCLQL